MYQIYADSNLIWDSTLEEYTITKGDINKEVNKSGSFVFTLYQNHPYYDRLVKLKTIIKVYRITGNGKKLLFRGRIINTSDGFYNDRTFTCEGELSFLLDSVRRPYSFTGSPADLFTAIIQNHNSQVGTEKQFIVGQITVEDNNDYINRSNTGYEDSLTDLNNALISTLGGYVFITYDANENAVINWFEDFDYLSTQSIDFGENLLDLTRTNSAENIVTAIIPLGANVGEGETATPLTIESVNDGVDYIYDQTAVNTYGWIFKTVTFDDVTVASNLKSKGQAYLNTVINLNLSIQLSAIDLSNMDADINAFSLGQYVPVKSEPHGIDDRYLLKQQSIDLLHPENNKITLGYTFSTFTDATLANTNTGTILNNKVTTIEGNYVPNEVLYSEVEALRSLITQSSDSIVMEVLQEYVTNDQVTEAVGTLYTQLKDSFEFAFTTLETTINDNEANTEAQFEEITKYIRFVDGDIILGQSDNELRIQIESDKITFYDNVNEVAYFSNHKLHVTDAEILDSLRIGNYAFLPRANGNLSFKRVT